MDGAKPVTDTIDHATACMVSRRSVRAKIFSRGNMNLIEMRILVVVRSEHGENPCRRKGKGSLAMKVSQGLVDPNRLPSGSAGKGNRLIFLYYSSMRGNTSLIADALE